MSANPVPPLTTLVTGATGYIGGRLVPELLDDGHQVVVLTRSRDRVRTAPWGDSVHVVEGDVNDATDLARALAGVDVAYYLVHSMDGEGDFVERDRRAAEGFAAAAADAGVGRIVYLGGLHPDGDLSPHLASRVEVGRVFLDSPFPRPCSRPASCWVPGLPASTCCVTSPSDCLP